MKQYQLDKEQRVLFYNHVDECIGTGRMGLALQKEYQEQLALVQSRIGFKRIRGHGLFSDDMAIYHEYEDAEGNRCIEYNFTYLDLVMDSYRSMKLVPFLELGFMPGALASGEQTVFYWKGNVTPPRDYGAWCDLVTATLQHLMDRYGADEVVTWPVEVWNEPNLPGFWKDADKEEYFHLFETTFAAVKRLDERFEIGGPAVCGGSDEEWISAFMEFCHNRHIPVSFVTRHHYTTEFPKRAGHYGYARLSAAEEGFANLRTTREIIDSYPEYRGLKIHITEFNTSYIPNCPLHDTNLNAAYIAQQLSRLGDTNESYSYWTFGDIFEEQGVPFTPFHGGFGLVANGCIPKPTFWSFQFYKQLQGECILKSEEAVITCTSEDGYQGILWNLSEDPNEPAQPRTIELAFPVCAEAEYTLIQRLVDEKTCNPLKLWHDLGEPASLSAEQKQLLQESAKPLVTSERITALKNRLTVRITLESHAVCYFQLEQNAMQGDRGYDYQRVMSAEK